MQKILHPINVTLSVEIEKALFSTSYVISSHDINKFENSESNNIKNEFKFNAKVNFILIIISFLPNICLYIFCFYILFYFFKRYEIRIRKQKEEYQAEQAEQTEQAEQRIRLRNDNTLYCSPSFSPPPHPPFPPPPPVECATTPLSHKKTITNPFISKQQKQLQQQLQQQIQREQQQQQQQQREQIWQLSSSSSLSSSSPIYEEYIDMKSNMKTD